MKKRFNDTGTCFPDKHYMVNISNKFEKTKIYIEHGDYFVINKPRQYGKTTMLEAIKRGLPKDEYLVIFISFAGLGDLIFETEESFAPEFLNILADKLEYTDEKNYKLIKKHNINILKLNDLSKAISKIVNELNKKVVLLIDEIDKSSNNQLFVSFLAMLRDKYLERRDKPTFHSVVLAGLHDIKNLKVKLRSDEEQKYNSPWNIAVEYEVNLNFSEKEIKTILIDYINDTGMKMDIDEISKSLHFYTSGYPYLVSKLCKIIDEKIDSKVKWTTNEILDAVKILLQTLNITNFDTVIQTLENNSELNNFIKDVLFGINDFNFSYQKPIINLASIHGLIKNENGKVRIHNKIYEEYIGDYYVSVKETSKTSLNPIQSMYIKPDGRLDIKKVLTKFQEVIKEKYN